MKLVIIALFSIFTGVAHAYDESSGLDCSMTYTASGALSSAYNTTSGWLVDGSEMESLTKVNDGDGIAIGQSAANYIKISKTKVDGREFWSVKVLGAEKNTIGVMSFPVDLESRAGMKSTFEVNALEDESEDPQQYDTLDVSCANTHFAG